MSRSCVANVPHEGTLSSVIQASTHPSVVVLVHGGPESIEAARARGLTQGWPADRLRLAFRSESRWRTASEWNRVIEEHRPEVVYVVNTAMPGALLAPYHQLRHRVPFVLDTGDVVFEMAWRAKTTSRRRLPALFAIEQTSQRLATVVVVRGTRHREHLERRGVARVEVIRDGFVERGTPDPKRVAALRAQHGLDGKFVVGVLGSLVHSPRLNICYGWDLVRALASLKDLPVRGLIVGDGAGREWLEALALRLGVSDRVAFAGRVRYDEVPTYLQLFDVALSTQTNNLPGQVRTTGKLPEYMAAGRFILASRVGDAELLLPPEMLVEYNGEVDEEYPARLAQRVRALHGDSDAPARAAQLKAVAARNCSYDVLSGQFERVVRSVCEGRA